jgi:hypothetical protein
MLPAPGLNTSSPSPAKQTANPFAKALLENESSLNRSQDNSANQPNPFSDALSKTGGNFDNNLNNRQDIDPLEQQRQAEAQRKREMLRRKLHDQVNPTDTRELFSARQKKVEQEINALRQELKMLVKEVGKFHKDVELTLMTQVVSPGQEGKYYLNFFQQLRALIMLLRQKIKSASTWATQLNGKSAKKKKQGIQFGGNAHEKASTIQDMMHHERSTQFSGG